MTSLSSSTTQCHIMYSSVIRCSNSVHSIHNGTPLCRYHYIETKYNEECPICYSSMYGISGKIMLKCGHIFHRDCLASWKEATCPMCRQKMCPQECRVIYGQTIFNPLIESIYELPSNISTVVIDTIKMIVDLSKNGNWYATNIYELIDLFSESCNLATNIVENRVTYTEEDTDNELYFEIQTVISKIIDVLTNTSSSNIR
jgi:hypothetical protein